MTGSKPITGRWLLPTALRRLERRLDYDAAVLTAEAPPSILICIPWREGMVAPMLRRPWTVETDPERPISSSRPALAVCREPALVVLIDEVKRFDRSFAWVYARR